FRQTALVRRPSTLDEDGKRAGLRQAPEGAAKGEGRHFSLDRSLRPPEPLKGRENKMKIEGSGSLKKDRSLRRERTPLSKGAVLRRERSFSLVRSLRLTT